MNEVYDIKVINKENNKDALFQVERRNCKYSLGCSSDIFLHNNFYLLKNNEKIKLTNELIEDKNGKTWRGLKPSKPRFQEVLENELQCKIPYTWFLQALTHKCEEIHFYPSCEQIKGIFIFIEGE